jgi:hypothetical protein
MKTDDLIRALAQDTTQAPGVARSAALVLPVALLISAGLFLGTMGLRAGLSTFAVASAIAIKLAITLTLALAGLALATRAVQPGRALATLTWVLALPVAALALALAFDLSRYGLENASARLFGTNYWRCMLAIPMLSLPLLAALLYALRRGAPTDLDAAGLFAGLGAAGLGASLYALHCTDDSPLFILAWYGIAAALVALLGRWAARRFLRW